MRARFPIGTNMRTCPMFVALMVLASASSVSAEEPKVGVAVLHSGEDPVGVGEAGFERRLQHFVEKISKRPGPIVPLSKNGRYFGKIQRWQIACVNGLPDMTTTRCVRRDL